jgi:hypothetical protein
VSTNRIIDSSSAEKLSTLVDILRDHDLAISMDYLGQRNLWIVQIFDAQERLVVSTNSENLNDAIRRTYENWFTKTNPKL